MTFHEYLFISIIATGVLSIIGTIYLIIQTKVGDIMSNRKRINNEHPNRIRNGNIRRDFKRLLEIIADDREPDFEEVEAIADKNALYYDDNGQVCDK